MRYGLRVTTPMRDPLRVLLKTACRDALLGLDVQRVPNGWDGVVMAGVALLQADVKPPRPWYNMGCRCLRLGCPFQDVPADSE